ncbi:hypothetical protein Cabys_1012 [Caldithrix abyssi DSM 13497]|uniref:Uncharacterized protein n=1 Tax=Caldithrix abyssi DSM 13497 TaxID=880073 RepID=A0A1J1C504_CALAY|nr:hypothetical protein Cabys_1012 [Caldithrix abyssi DSM 13497]
MNEKLRGSHSTIQPFNNSTIQLFNHLFPENVRHAIYR